MKILELFNQPSMDSTLLIGYYGGGNYGDELLMEVLANLYTINGRQDIAITYQTPETFETFHRDLGHSLIPTADKGLLFKTILKKKNIMIGGGGLWGLDVNFNIFIMSSLLFCSRWLLGKKISLVGVGYYSSTNRLGHLSAWLAAKAANVIIARDPETLQSFGKLNKNVSLDTDIAWCIKDLDLSAYANSIAELEKQLVISNDTKTLFITLRRFKKIHQNDYTQQIGRLLEQNQHLPIIVSIMEPRAVDPEGYACIENWAKTYRNVQCIDFSFNPLYLYLFFQKYYEQLVVIAPQFHALITAHLTKTAFLPLVYDNKSAELLAHIGKPEYINIKELSLDDLQSFVDKNTGKA